MSEDRLKELLLEVGEEVRREIRASIDTLRDERTPFFQGHRGSAMYMVSKNTINSGNIVTTTSITKITDTGQVPDIKAINSASAAAVKYNKNAKLNAKLAYKTVYSKDNSRYYYCFFSQDKDPLVIVVDPDGSLYDDAFPESGA